MNLEIIPNGAIQRVHVSQNDIGRTLTFNLFNDSLDYIVPSGATVKIQGTKPSGFGFSETCTVNGNTVTIDTTEAMTDESGNIQTELSISYDDVVLGTSNFVLAVEKCPHPDGTIDGTADNPSVENLEVIIANAVDEWLDEHPEATTTVQDGTISDAKLNATLKAKMELYAGTILNADIFWRNAYGNYYSLDSQPSETAWSEIQGITTTDDTIICVFNSGDFYDRLPNNVNSNANLSCLREYSKDTKELIREVKGIQLYHANSLAYNSDENVIYVACNGERTSSGSLSAVNTIAVVDYETFSVIEYKTIADVRQTVSVSYNPTNGLMIYCDSVCYFLDENYDVIRTVSIDIAYTKILGGIQTAKHTDNYIFVSTFYPNTIMCYDITGNYIKSFSNANSEQYEQEDIAIESDGTCYITCHKRFYNRNSTNEVHEDYPTILKGNVFSTHVAKEIYATVVDNYILYVDTNTNNTIQDGTSAYPCKTLMQALWVKELNPSIKTHIDIMANSVCKWLRSIEDIIYINANGSTISSNMALQHSNVYLYNAVIADVDGVVCYPYSSNGNVYISRGSDLYMHSCSYNGSEHIVVRRSAVHASDITFPSSSSYTWYGEDAQIFAPIETLRSHRIIVAGRGVSNYQVLYPYGTENILTHSVNNVASVSVSFSFTDGNGTSHNVGHHFVSVYGDSTSSDTYSRFPVAYNNVPYYVTIIFTFTTTSVSFAVTITDGTNTYNGNVTNWKIDIRNPRI